MRVEIPPDVVEVIIPPGDILDDFNFRKGRFLVSYDLLKSAEVDHRVLQGIFSHFLIRRCISHFDREVVEYSALSALFERIDEGMRIPMYNIQNRKTG